MIKYPLTRMLQDNRLRDTTEARAPFSVTSDAHFFFCFGSSAQRHGRLSSFFSDSDFTLLGVLSLHSRTMREWRDT